MTTPGVPDPENAPYPEGDLSMRILDKMAELIYQDDPGLSRSMLAELIVFDSTMDGDTRWDLLYSEIEPTIIALTDPALAGIVTIPPTPQRVFWKDPEGYPIETTLVRFNEMFSLAYESTLR
jgi:hypothetical protein